MSGGERPLDWSAFVPPIVNPTKKAIVQTLAREGKPLSAREVLRLIDPESSLSRVSYHLGTLVDERVLLEKGGRSPRSSVERLYVLAPQRQGGD